MKKLVILILLNLIIVGGCSTKEKTTTSKENDVPINEKAGKSSSDSEEERKKENLSDSELANRELEAADESGAILRTKENEYVLEQTRTEKVTGEDGEDAESTYSTGEEITFTVTKETEVKAVLYDSDSLKSRLVKANQTDIKEGVFVSIFGQKAGEKYVASKVIILQIN